MLLEGNSKQVLIIERSSFGEPGTSGDDDLLLNVTVEVGGYSAADQDLRLKYIILAGKIIRTARSVVMKLSDRYPYQEMYEHILSG